MTYWQEGKFGEAEQALRGAVQAKPDYAEAYYTLGTVLKQEKKLPEAAAALREAIRLQPSFAGAHGTLAAVLREQGDAAGAASESQAAQQLMKQQTSLQAAVFATNSGTRLLNAGDLDGAIGQFERAIQLSAGYAPAHFQLAQALARKGQRAQAGQEFQKAKQLDPHLQAPSR